MEGSKMRIHYSLDIDDKGQIVCRHCGKTICPATKNYKLFCPRTEVYPSEIPGQRPSREDALTVYYEYYCPGCYTQLDVEVSEKGSPPLWDIQVKV